MEKRLLPEKRLGAAIRSARLAAGWSQEELSFQCGLHRTYIGSVERGEKNLTLKNLLRIAKSMQLSGASLLQTAEL
jgi:transcriptional regulator with XRE-family HTH domain